MKFFGGKSKQIKELQPEKQKAEEKQYEPPLKLPAIKRPSQAPLSAPPMQPAPAPPPAPRNVRPSRATSSGSPPLFIKVDKYRDIVKNIRDLKSSILNLRDALDVLEDMQKEVVNGIGIAHKSLDGLNVVIANLDSYFLKPQGIGPHMEEDIPEPGMTSPGEMERNMKDVYGQVEKLRAQLKAIK